MQVGINYGRELMLITEVKNMPKPIPTREEVVYWDTALPEMSPMLFLLANLMLMEALEADESR